MTFSTEENSSFLSTGKTKIIQKQKTEGEHYFRY